MHRRATIGNWQLAILGTNDEYEADRYRWTVARLAGTMILENNNPRPVRVSVHRVHTETTWKRFDGKLSRLTTDIVANRIITDNERTFSDRIHLPPFLDIGKTTFGVVHRGTETQLTDDERNHRRGFDVVSRAELIAQGRNRRDALNGRKD